MVVRTTALFCDDARRDEYGTFVLVGVYAGVINIQRGKKDVKVGNYIAIENLPDGEHEVRFEVSFTPEETEEPRVLADQTVTLEGEADTTLVIAPMGLKLALEDDGMIRLHWTRGDSPKEELCKLRVNLIDVDEDEDEDEI